MIQKSVSVDEHQLLDAYLVEGNNQAISKLIERHRRRVYDYIYLMVKDAEVAEDICQETFVKAIRVIEDGRYEDNGKFQSWVMRIAHNQVIDYFRRQKKAPTITESEAGYDIIGTQRLSEGSIEEKIVKEQIEADLRQLVEQLPEEQREVVKMRYYAGLSFKEIAEQTNVSINTALGRMRYALTNLRRMIKENNLILS